MLKLPARINGISSTSISTVVSGPLQSVRDRRIQSDLQSDLLKQLVTNDKVLSIHLPDGANKLDHLRVHIRPSEGIYKSGFFVFDVQVPHDFPYKPPIVKCVTSPVFHPYILGDGVCISLLRNAVVSEEQGWNPTRGLADIFLALKSLFYDLIEGPLASDPLDVKAAEVFKSNQRTFRERVAACIRDASPKEAELTYPTLFSNGSSTASSASPTAQQRSASSVNGASGSGSSAFSTSAALSSSGAGAHAHAHAPHSLASFATSSSSGASLTPAPSAPSSGPAPGAKPTAASASTSKTKKK